MGDAASEAGEDAAVRALRAGGFFLVVDEVWRAELGFRLFETVRALPPTATTIDSPSPEHVVDAWRLAVLTTWSMLGGLTTWSMLGGWPRGQSSRRFFLFVYEVWHTRDESVWEGGEEGWAL